MGGGFLEGFVEVGICHRRRSFMGNIGFLKKGKKKG